MELESIQSGSKNSDLPKNYKAEAPEGDAKEAFLAVLQGLVGFLSPAQVLPANIPIYKIAQLEIKEEQKVVKEERKFDETLDNTSNSKKEAASPSKDSSENVSEKVDIDVSENSSEPVKQPENTEKPDTLQNKPEVELDKVVEVAQVVEDQSHLEIQVKGTQVTTASAVSADGTGEENLGNTAVDLNLDKNVEQLVTKDSAPIQVQKEVIEEEVTVQPKELKKEVVEAKMEEPVLANSTPSEVTPELSSESTETVRVLNAKPVKREGRSLEDEIEISYFEAKDLLQNSLNIQSNQVDNPVSSASFPHKETLDNNAISALLRTTISASPGFLDINSNPLMAKNSNIKLDSSQAIIQANKAVFDKGSSEKLVNNSFSARTAQAQIMIDKVKAVLEQATVNKTNDTITVKVEPANLGELTVKVSEKKGQIYAKITPQSKEIEEILRSQSKELSLVIQALGYKEEDVQVSIGSASPDFYSAFSQTSGFQGEQGGFNKGSRRAGLGLAGGMKESGINIDNNLTSEDLIGWIA